MKIIQTITSKTKQLRFRSLLGLLPMLLLLLAGNVQAQLAIKYPLAINPLGVYSSISGTGTAQPALLADDASALITGLSPAFVVNGVPYTKAKFNSNGWIMLYTATAPGTNGLYGTALSAGTANAAVIIAPFNADQNGVNTGAAAYTQTIGNEHIFEWKDFRRFGSGVGTEFLNYQVRLNTATGAIQFVYGNCTIGGSTSNVSVGWKTNGTVAGNWATDINNLQVNVTGSNAGCTWANAVTNNTNTAQMYYNAANPSVKPNNGLTFTWAPQANPDPVRTFGAVTGITGTSANISWTAPAGAAQYNVQYRVQGDCNWTNHPLNPFLVANAAITGLVASTTYQVRVQAQTAGGALSSIWSHVPTSAAGAGLNGYVATGTFSTLCPGISSFPWNEGFEAVGIPNFPSCWTKENGDWVTTNNANSGFDANARTGANFLRDSWSATNEYMWSPGFDLVSGTSYDFSFYWAGDGSAGWQGDVFYNTAPTSVGATVMGASFVALATTTTFTYTKVTKTLVAPTTGTYHFAIRVNCPTATPWYISFDDFAFEATPTCSAPPAIALTGYNSNSASFSWIAASPAPASGYEWEVRTAGAGGSGPVGLTTSGSTGAGVTTASSGAVLAPSSTYNIYVRSNCGGTFSSWTGPLTFLTTCADINSYPYNMPFDGSAACWQTGFGFVWDLVANGTNPANTPFSGSGQARFNSFNIASGGAGSLIAPPFTFPSDLYRVRFKMYRDDGYLGADEKVEVYYNTSPLLTGATLLGTINRAIDMAPVEAANGWYEYAFNMPGGSTGSGRFIILRATSDFGNNMFVDDFNVELQPSCNNPTALTATATSLTTANLSWTAAAPAPASGYEWEVRTSGVGGSGPVGLDASGTTGAGVTTASATGLTGNTNYTLWVRSNCAGAGFSIWVSNTFYTGYCPTAFTDVTYEHITNVNYAGLNNTSVGFIGGPVNYTAQVGNVQIGVANNLSVTIEADFAEYVYAFIDWNQDLDFNDVGETYTVVSNTGANGPHIISITPPGGATLGNTRLRVILDWNNAVPDPCANATFGEVEDYTLNVSPAPTCFPPTLLNATPTSLVLADVTWALPVSGTPVSYEYEVSTSATPPVSGTVTAGFGALAQTTVANTTNYLHVRSYCGGVDYSAWATYPFYSGYCQPTHTTVNSSYITNFTTANGTVNINNNSTFVAGGYQDFTAVSASQYAGSALNLNVTFANPSCGIGIWVDWNNDLDFNDALEQVYVSGAYLGSPQSIPYTIPAVAVGSYTMRVRIDWIATSPTACGNLTQGEAEDYTLNVVALPACGSVSFAGTYTTSSDVALACTGQTVNFTSSPAAPVASGITYRLQHSTLIGGPYSTVDGPQATSSFAYSTPTDGYYRIQTLCTGSPVAATWVPVLVSISDPVLNSITPGSSCGPGSVELSAVQTPALASVVWYDSPVSTVPLEIGNTFNTPVIGATTTYYASATNVSTGFANVGTALTSNNASGVTPYTTIWENARTYYMITKAELVASGLMPGDITSMAFDVTVPGGFVMSNFTVRMATSSASNVVAGFATPTGAFTTVYTAATQAIPTVGLNTIPFSTNFNWNGSSNIIIELCHENDIVGPPNENWATSSTVRHTVTAYTSVYSIYQDDVTICGSTTGDFTATSTQRPNIRFGGEIAGCASNRLPVVATINTIPSISGPGDQFFAPTIFAFTPLTLTSGSGTPGAVVTYTPAASIYVDAATSALYTSGTDVNAIPQYFAPLSTITYSAVATLPNGCSASAPFTITVDATGIPNSACAAASVTTGNTLNFQTVNTLGAVPGLGFPCGGIANQVWFKTVVPASGEVHVVTKANGVSLTDLTATNIAMYTSTNCSTIVNTACNYDGATGDFSYAYTEAPVGSTVYIRVSGLLASAVQNGRALMAVTAGLVWTPTNGDNVALAENWQGGDATSITTPSATQSVIIPAGTTKPKLYANTSVRSATFLTTAPYFVSTGIDLNSFTLSIKKDWILGPVASSSTVLNCNGLVEFNGAVAQSISGRTTFGNLTLNNTLGLTLTNTTGVSCILKANLGTITTGGFLVLRSPAANSAALVDYNGVGTISGNASVERKIGPVSGYHYLSAPVSGQVVNSTTNGWRDDFSINAAQDGISFIPGGIYTSLPTVWEYQEFVSNPSPDYGWVSATSAADAITPLKGFACVVPANVTVDLLGPLNNGAITPYSITLTDNGLNLLGNPYPAPISWNAFRSTNAGKLSLAGYKAFVTTGGYAGSYGTWDGSTGTSGVTDVIASSQSFFATALIGSTTITSSNVNRLFTASDVNATFFGYSYVPDLIRMDITGNAGASQMAVYFNDARSDVYDNDATALMSAGTAPTIYSVVDNQNLSINAMGKLNLDKVVPLGVKIQAAGNYNIVATDMTSFAPSVIAYLEDAQTGTITNLRINPSYSVSLPVGDINNRFFLHFHPAVELNAVNETCAGNDGKLLINYPTTNTVNIVIKDANGNVVSTQNNVNGAVAINNLVAGNYVAEMTFGIAPNVYTTSDYFTVAGGNAVFANLSASANTVDMASNTTVNFTATAQGASSFNWNFGDGTVVTNGPANISHTFAQAGTYNVTFEASNGICNTVATTTVEVTNATGLTAIANSNLQVIGAGSKVTVRFGNNFEGTGNIEVINMLGEVVAHLDNVSMKGTREIEMSSIAAGQYMVKITNNNKLFTEKVFLSRQ